MICIYSPGNTNYSNNGDAVLIPISCFLNLTINGAWQLDLEHPYDAEERYKLIQEGAVIRADIKCVGEQSTIRQRFRIYTYNRGVNSVTCIAFPIAMEATFDAPIDNLVLENKTASEAVAELQELTDKYSIETNVTGTKSTSFANTNINSALASGDDGCFIQVWGGEVVYDNLKFNIRSRIGSDTGYKIQYGHNMTGIDYSKDDSGLSTRVHPISEDGIRLNGTGYVDSPLIDNYPIHHDRYMITPYRLVDTEEASPSRTAQETRACVSAVTTATTTLSQSSYATALGAGYQPDYIKTINADIITAVQNMALVNVISADLYKLLSDTIKNAMAWLADLTQPEWGWMGSDQTGWRYGDTNGYAKDMYVRIGKTWSYFGSQGYWEEPKDDKEEWDWYQKEGEGRRYGNFNKYFAHNTFVYITMEGTLQEYWFNEEGWYEADESGESEWSWHGSGTSEDPYWFGEEGATSEDPKKYAHDTWLFIDGAYYFFDSYGYYAPNTAILDYQWDWVQDDERWWFGNAENREFAAVYVESQWLKINGTWYYFDEDGYVVDQDSSRSDAIAVFTTGMASLLTTVNTRKDALYTLLYALMTEWVNKKYAEGIDKPALTVSVSMADLSRTTEYANFAALETIKLGDSVEIDDTEHGIHTTGSRVIGLTYDVIRGYNSNVVIGKPQATVSSMLSQANGQAVAGGFDTSAIEAQIDALQDRVSDVRYNGRSLLQGTIAILDSIGGTSINYGTSTPTGGSDGDVYFQTDANGNIVKIWQNHSGVWSGMTGGNNIYAGVNVPTNSLGEENDLYLRYGALNVDVINDTDVTYTKDASHPLDLTSFLANSHNSFDFEIQGKASSTAVGEEVAFDTYGLAEGKQYTITFTGKFASGNTHDEGWASYFYVGVDGDYSVRTQLADDNNSHDYTVTFTAGEVNKFRFGFYNLHPERTYTFTVTSFNIEGIFNSGWYEIYGKIENNWSKYVGDESGGSEVIPNPQGTATDTLYTIGIDGTIYELSGEEYEAGENISITDNVISATDTTYSDFGGTDGTTAGSSGLVPAPATTDVNKYLKGDGTWAEVQGGGGGSSLILDAQRYSLDEQVVGIWTDGKPLYQRTVTFTGTFYGNMTIGANPVTNVDVYASISISAKTVDGTWRDMNFAHSNSQVNAGIFISSSNNFELRTGTSVTASAAYNKFVVIMIYTKTTDVAGSGGYQAYGFSPIIYSDTEREIGVWRDNKPIYQRTFVATSPSATDTSTSIITMPTGIENVVSLVGFINQSGAIAQENLNFFIWYRKPQNDIACRVTNTNWKSCPMFVTVRYTKLADVAGSGEYNTLAIPNVHYSTDEQVIGTWMGETLYQKTWELSSVLSVASNTWIDTSILKQGIDAIIYINGANAEGAVFSFLGARAQTSTTNYVQIQQTRNSAITLKYITIQYTKTT